MNLIPTSPITSFKHLSISCHVLRARSICLGAKSICTSSATGFQYDSLALYAVVKLIQRALADHREIFQDKDPECLEASPRNPTWGLLKPVGPNRLASL